MTDRFVLDKANGKLLGVCAGISNASGMDALAVRLIAAVSLLILGPVAIMAYLIAALLAPSHR